MTVHQT